MKAISLVPGTTNLHISDVDEPQIKKKSEIKIKILEVGICGTDREEASGGRADAPSGEKELIIGHEMFGKVVELGAPDLGVNVGDPVVLTVRRGCNKCQPCKADCPDMCETGNYTERGIKGRNGYQAEYVVEDIHYLIKVPPTLKDLAVMTEPTTVVEKAIDHSCRLQTARLPVDPDPMKWLKGKTALVAGLGPIGLLGAMVLLLRGAKVIGIDRADPSALKPQILQAMGGIFIQSTANNKENILKAAPQIDLILDAAGVPTLDFDMLTTLGFNGILALTGVPGKGHPLTVQGAAIFEQMVLKNQILFGSVNAGHKHFEQAVIDLEAARIRWPGQIERIITSRTPYTDFAKVLESRSKKEIKAVITW
jgi:threonine dehydrogenase-like Zn-dependent dehydrogenase